MAGRLPHPPVQSAGRHYGEVSCRSYRDSVLAALPHRCAAGGRPGLLPCTVPLGTLLSLAGLSGGPARLQARRVFCRSSCCLACAAGREPDGLALLRGAHVSLPGSSPHCLPMTLCAVLCAARCAPPPQLALQAGHPAGASSVREAEGREGRAGAGRDGAGGALLPPALLELRSPSPGLQCCEPLQQRSAASSAWQDGSPCRT